MSEEQMEIAPVIKPLRGLPPPPDFLIRDRKKIEPITTDVAPEESIVPPNIEAGLPMPLVPKYVDYLSFQAAVEDRNRTETAYAELYGQYLDLLVYSEKQTRLRHAFSRFKQRIRQIIGSKNSLIDLLQRQLNSVRSDLKAAEKTVETVQMDNDGLRSGIENMSYGLTVASEKQKEAQTALLQTEDELKAVKQDYQKTKSELKALQTQYNTLQRDLARLCSQLVESKERWDQFREKANTQAEILRQCFAQEKEVSSLQTRLNDSLHEVQVQVKTLEASHILGVVEPSLQPKKTPNQDGAGSNSSEMATKDSRWVDLYNRWSHTIDEITSVSGSLKPKPEISEKKKKKNPKPIPGESTDHRPDFIE